MKWDKHTKQSIEVLQENQLKATSARVELLDIFKHTQKPLSVTDIFKMFQKIGVDKVTLYRNMDSLVNLGIIRQVRLKDRQAYYELASHGHHHHVVCSQCGRIKDMSGCGINFVSKKFLKLSGFAKITEHSLEFFGVCASCMKKR
ncbi:MAG: transcriptional repressor [Candidatus Magasanikbacteria bacterium]|nr:transcriptional repressor [Candidatus Magasanikbacteria bacterium]